MNFTLNSDSQFTLTVISTGGPATTVTWTRGYYDENYYRYYYNYYYYRSITVTEGTETVLNDPETANYTHTLTVTGRLGGNYTCTVANEALSNSSQLDVQGNEVYI